MNFLLTDDEPLQLQELTSILRRIRPEAQVFAYTWPDDALEGAVYFAPLSPRKR